MYCTQCGCKIEEEFKFCPGCGCSVMQGNPADNRSELDRIADEIASECPAGALANAKELSKRAGIPYNEAHDMMWNRRKQWKQGKKQGNYPNTQYCPSCGSQHIESYEEPGITVTSRANVFGGMYISSSNPSTKWMRCDRCGYRWRPKK